MCSLSLSPSLSPFSFFFHFFFFFFLFLSFSFSFSFSFYKGLIREVRFIQVYFSSFLSFKIINNNTNKCKKNQK